MDAGNKLGSISEKDSLVIPAHIHPGFRTQIAINRGVERNLLFTTWGGLGDQMCAEPTLRYALKAFKDCKVTLESQHPEIFSHLNFHEVVDSKKFIVNRKNYLVFETITPPDDSNMVWLFFSHMLTNCVDFPAMCSMRLQLPVADKEIQLTGKIPEIFQNNLSTEKTVAVHPGRHWQSKTFPKEFWDKVLTTLIENKITPIIIGADTDDNRGTVDVNPYGCIDLRNKLSVQEFVWTCQNVKVVLTNDSSPLHAAASGDAWIGYVATCKHPDMISHWRKGEWNWREKNFGKGGIWDIISYCPNVAQKIDADKVPEEALLSWLPCPVEFALWAVDKATR